MANRELTPVRRSRVRRAPHVAIALIAVASALAAGCATEVSGHGPGGPGGKGDDPGGDQSNEPSGLVPDPAEISIAVDESIQLAAALVDQDGNTLDPDPEVAWSSVDASIASISADGLLTGEKDGTVRVTGLYGGFQTQVQVTVGDPPEPPCDDVIYVCGQLYYSCDGGTSWQESNEGGCTLDTPESCSCGEYLRLFYGGDNPDNLGYCSASEPLGASAATCDCDYCVPE